MDAPQVEHMIKRFGSVSEVDDVSLTVREGGFDWGPIDMDDLWVGLVERAVRKKFPTKP